MLTGLFLLCSGLFAAETAEANTSAVEKTVLSEAEKFYGTALKSPTKVVHPPY